MNGKKLETNDLFRWISKLSSEADWTPEETREALSEAGLHPDAVAGHILQLVTRLKKETPYSWKASAHAMRTELLEKIRRRVTSETIGLTRPQLLKRLNEAISRLPGPVAAQYGVAFRKFEEAAEEDLRSMLEEIAIIEDLEQGESRI
ncbi:MAG: hypothetical protein AABN95_24500 [Acidobacteriota bacterium]